MARSLKMFVLLLLTATLLMACTGTPAATEEPEMTQEPTVEATEEEPMVTEEPAATEEPTPTEEAAEVDPGDVVFFSTQFTPVEEQEKFRAILQEEGFDYTASEEGPLLDVVLAGNESGEGTVDVIGALHGSYLGLAREGALMNLIDLADDLSADRELNQSYLETGLLGSDDTLYYIPWMQATYIMAANVEALEYLPEGADLNALTYDQLADWCQNILAETGEPRCGFPHAGLFHRFLQGYLWPSYTGGTVTEFRSDAAAGMLAWARDELWPAVHPQSITYEFMQEPLLSGEVWVAFDHTARLINALNEQPEQFVTFPAPAGPAGRAYMPVIVGLAIPEAAPNPEGGMALIEYLTRPDVQSRVLRELAFFPVVSGVDTSDLPPGTELEAQAVEAMTTAPDAFPALLPVGLGDRGNDFNQFFKNAFDRVVINGEDIATVLAEEGANLESLMNETGAPCWAPDSPSEGPCPVNP